MLIYIVVDEKILCKKFTGLTFNQPLHFTDPVIQIETTKERKKMAPLKGRAIAASTNVIEVRGPNKTVGIGKFKIYSEKDKVIGRNQDVAGATSLRTSLVSNKKAPVTKNNGLKDIASGAEERKGSYNTLGKMKVGRKPLADVSNIRGTSSVLDKKGGSRNLLPIGTLASTASSRKSLMVKGKTSLTNGVPVSHFSCQASTKIMRTSSNIDSVQACENVEKKSRQISRNTSTITRKSFPVLKGSSQLGANKSKGDATSSEKAMKKIGFPLRTRNVGKVACQLSNHKGKFGVSNTLMASRNQTKKEVPQTQKLKKSIKPLARTSQTFSVCKKSNSFSSRDNSRGVKVTESSITKNLKSIDSHEEVFEGRPAEDSANVKPEKSETTVDKRTSRRKSYTSLLLSKSKLLMKKDEVVEQENLPNIDDQDNPLEVSEYVDDIYQYYWTMEAQSTSLANYMGIQFDISPKMRGILVNWLTEVHVKFDLMPETLYLTVALLDRYLSLVSINKKDMQLVGLTSLLLASKYEDFWHPRVKDLISISAESYTRQEMLDMEKGILKKLKFRLNLPTAYVFMLRFLKASQSDEQLEHLSFYLIELCLVDYEALKFKTSLLCASAIYVSRCTLNKVPAWTPLLTKHTRYEGLQIRDCAEMIYQIHKSARTGNLKVTYDKYKRPEFGGVATLKPLATLP